MKLADRLLHVAHMVPVCNCLADIGTDHGYVPIYCINNNIAACAIACDIKKGPIKIAKANIKKYNLENKIETRIGNGLSTLNKGEADVIVIAGMGGNIISSIIESEKEIALKSSCLVVQPMQYPEMVRYYAVNNGFLIEDEDLVKEDNKYYHIIRMIKGKENKYENEAYYFTGKRLIEKGNPLIKEYIEYKIYEYGNILKELENSSNNLKYNEILKLKQQFEDVEKCL